MNFGESLCAVDMRLILKAIDAIDHILGEGKTVGLRFSGSIDVIDYNDSLKGVIDLDEDLAVYVPASCRDCIPVIETGSDGAK